MRQAQARAAPSLVGHGEAPVREPARGQERNVEQEPRAGIVARVAVAETRERDPGAGDQGHEHSQAEDLTAHAVGDAAFAADNGSGQSAQRNGAARDVTRVMSHF
jgi:hypothetical protein